VILRQVSAQRARSSARLDLKRAASGLNLCDEQLKLFFIGAAGAGVLIVFCLVLFVLKVRNRPMWDGSIVRLFHYRFVNFPNPKTRHRTRFNAVCVSKTGGDRYVRRAIGIGWLVEYRGNISCRAKTGLALIRRTGSVCGCVKQGTHIPRCPQQRPIDPCKSGKRIPFTNTVFTWNLF